MANITDTKIKILIVEDEWLIADDIQECLLKLDYTVTSIVPSGEEAIEISAREKPDLILMDIYLKGNMNGIEAAEQIQRKFNIPHIYLTSYADSSTLNRAKKTAPYGYILKPFNDKELQITIEMALYKHQIEKKLKEREERLRLITFHSPVDICEINSEGIILFLNHKMGELNPEDALGTLFPDLFPIETRNRIESTINSVFSDLKEQNIEYSISNDREINRHYIARIAPVIIDDKALSAIIISNDITELKITQESLRKSHEFLLSIINCIADPIMVINKNFDITLMNYAAQKGALSSFHNKCYQVSHQKNSPCEGESHPCPLSEVLKTKKAVSMTHAHKNLDGETIFVDITASPLLDSSGRIEGIIENFRDITERVKNEAKLHKYSKELEESNSLKDLFTDIIRHDIVNFIQIISLKMEDMQSEEIYSNPTKEDFDLISENIKNINELVTNATKYSMLEKKEDLDFEKLDIYLILQKAVNDLNCLHPENEKRIIIEKTSNFRVLCNQMIREAIVNLLSNALKYSPPDSKVYTGILKNEKYYTIYVKDNGDGIPDSHKTLIFERFIRNDHKGIKGSGLGLAISKKIVELHNGRIWVEDNPEGGCVFFIEIPFEKNS